MGNEVYGIFKAGREKLAQKLEMGDLPAVPPPP